MSAENKAVVRRVLEAFNQGKLDEGAAYVAPDFVWHGPGFDVRGPEGWKQMAGMYKSAFPDAVCTVDDQIAEGDKVVGRWTARGIHTGPLRSFPPTGRRVTLTGIDIFRIEDGKIAEEWSNADGLGLLQQLGIIPSMG